MTFLAACPQTYLLTKLGKVILVVLKVAVIYLTYAFLQSYNLLPGHVIFIIKMDIELMDRYVSPINPAVFPHLATVLLAIGTFFTAWFFVFEVSRPKHSKESTICKELLISFFASLFLGFGILFLLLSVGIYV